ncbi:hypothetical protein C8R48DRAFT_678198 [Suillus tomentosus]|nr:hypothetical protein C8R48DRAFT_678198 [Suillus tomentosus]
MGEALELEVTSPARHEELVGQGGGGENDYGGRQAGSAWGRLTRAHRPLERRNWWDKEAEVRTIMEAGRQAVPGGDLRGRTDHLSDGTGGTRRQRQAGSAWGRLTRAHRLLERRNWWDKEAEAGAPAESAGIKGGGGIGTSYRSGVEKVGDDLGRGLMLVSGYYYIQA